MAAASFSSVPESVCEELEFSSESNYILLMALMEETREEHDQYYADDRLLSMIQSLEAEISSTPNSIADPYQSCGKEEAQMDDQDCSTSSIYFSSDYDDMEVVSASSSFDEEMMNAWSLCDADGDDSTYDYYDSYYGVLLENYLPQEATDVPYS